MKYIARPAGLAKRSPKQIARAGATLVTGMTFLPFIPLNKKSRWTVAKTTSKLKKLKDTKI